MKIVTIRNTNFGNRTIILLKLEGDWIHQKLDYVHDNPVEAGWVREPEHYEYSSASNYAQKGGPLNVISIYDGVEI